MIYIFFYEVGQQNILEPTSAPPVKDSLPSPGWGSNDSQTSHVIGHEKVFLLLILRASESEYKK